MAEWIIQTAILAVLGIISFFLKNLKADLEKNDTELKQQIDDVEAKFNNYKLEVADKYVQKDDFIRATAQMERKLDRIYDELIKINKGSEAKS
ncbi:hypothetical protein [Lysinibacillus piscis]|uniref:Uncharacterized protein n=1 Tax=Lysinibacillus piscis TaxID=2518931 RepID=A0ABQ5NGL1_9BACI|nr:hypothetical protein [Lysinibacillus sp. KH24]GLC87507.1 hypothetical protein LYSBPC_06340 [Lysinibacillus sp. KH24]